MQWGVSSVWVLSCEESPQICWYTRSHRILPPKLPEQGLYGAVCNLEQVGVTSENTVENPIRVAAGVLEGKANPTLIEYYQ